MKLYEITEPKGIDSLRLTERPTPKPDFVNTVFNYPTLAECYKNAALDGINRLNA